MSRAVVSNAYAAKRAIIEHLQQISRLGQGGLGKAQVSYAWPGGTGEQVQVFAGLVQFNQPGEDDLQDGDDILVKEIANISLFIRAVVSPAPTGGVETVEELVEQIADEIADEIARNRHMAGGDSLLRITSGLGEEEPLDGGNAARLLLTIAVESYLRPEPD